MSKPAAIDPGARIFAAGTFLGNVERVDDQGNVLGDDGEPMGHVHDQAGTEPVNPFNP